MNTPTSPQITLKLYRSHKGQYTSPQEICFVIAILIFFGLFNALCIYKLCHRRRLRPIDYLLGNLSFSVIFVCFTGTVINTNSIDVLPIPPQWKCSLVNYLKHLTSSIASTASFAVSYERLSSLDVSRNKSKRFTLSTWTLIQLSWISGAGITLPTLLTSVSPPETLANLTSSSVSSASCWKVPLFYSKFLEIWYELVKFVFLHLAFTLCVFTELFLVRSKLRYMLICNWQQKGKLKSKITRVRCAFTQSVLFIVLWNAVGLSNVLYTVYTWYSLNNQLAVLSTLLGIMRGVGYVCYLINPMFLVYSNQTPKFWPIQCSYCSYISSSSCFSNSTQNTNTNNTRATSAHELHPMSHLTKTNNKEDNRNNTRHEPTISQDDNEVSRFATQMNPSESPDSSQQQDAEPHCPVVNSVVRVLVHPPDDDDHDNSELICRC